MCVYCSDMKRKPAEKRTATGIVSVTRRGVGYVTLEGVERDIEVAPEDLGTALHRDTVEVKRLPRQGKERARGKIVRVISRAQTRFVGTLEKENEEWYLKADNPRMHRRIAIPARAVPRDAAAGMKVYVAMREWNDATREPTGDIIKVIGRAGEHDTEMTSIVLEHGFEAAFPKEVEEDAKRAAEECGITNEEIAKRRDMRDVPTCTIDPDDAKDFDDALSVRTLENGNVEVGIHIADVSHYVLPGSAVDKEAQERGTSIYLVDRTIPMLPEVLSNDVCSLNPGEDKLTYSAIFELDKSAHVQSRWFGGTVIHSNKRFTYDEAQEVLDSKSGTLSKELTILNTLAKELRARRTEAGAISFEQDEVKFTLDEHGKPITITKKERTDSNFLIEDFMLLANREVATYMHNECKKQGLRETVFVYRVHDAPDADKLEELAIFLRAIGYDFDAKGGEVSGQEINKLFEEIEGTDEEHLIKTATIRAMAKAVYSTKNIGHFGLAFQYYTHFTSPIRRYPDIMVHRIMKSVLGGKRLSKEQLRHYERLAIQSSQREIEAVEAERDSIKYKQVEYMKEHIGKVFDGTVTGVTEWGLFVEENETRAEGLVRIRDVGKDYYRFDEKHYRLIGDRGKQTYALGDQVRVKLVGADLERRTLDWVLVPNDE